MRTAENVVVGWASCVQRGARTAPSSAAAGRRESTQALRGQAENARSTYRSGHGTVCRHGATF